MTKTTTMMGLWVLLIAIATAGCDDPVVILVRVPALKNYTGGDRTALMTDVLWAAAKEAVAKEAKDKELVVAARGALLYGGIASGKLGEEPKVVTSGVSAKSLYRYFASRP